MDVENIDDGGFGHRNFLEKGGSFVGRGIVSRNFRDCCVRRESPENANATGARYSSSLS